MRFVSILFLLFTSLSFGQDVYLHQNTKVFTSIGASFFNGDICPDCSNLGLVTTINPRFHIQKKLYFSPSFSFSRFSADDKNSTNKKTRALSFFSNNYQLDINILYFLDRYGNYTNESSIHPYCSIGAGSIFFNPKAIYNNTIYTLQDFQTEGASYNRNTFTLNGKFGLLIEVNKNISFDISYSYFYTGSDYIDDVSQNYISQNNLIGVGADLADRSDEFGFTPTETKDGFHWYNGSQRGSNSRNDHYSFLQIGLGFTIPK